ncbi:MAG: hypothetical protein QOH97_2917 [Actinoplanes sp.]|nr:hypothetical protein [Actinoplanes sp.]
MCLCAAVAGQVDQVVDQGPQFAALLACRAQERRSIRVGQATLLGEQLEVADSAGGRVTYSYNTAGQLATVAGVDGAVTWYGYNTARQLAVVTQPGGGFTRNTYDSKRRVVR